MAAVTDRLALAIQGVAARTAAHSTLRRIVRRPRPTSLLVTSGTELLALSLGTRATTVLAKGLSHPAGVALDAAGRTAYVADLDTATGSYTVVAVPVVKRPKPSKVHHGTGRPGQLALYGSTLAFVDAATGRLITVDLRHGTETVVGTGLAGAGGVSFSDDGSRIHVVETGSGRWLSIAPGEPAFTVEATGLASPQHLTAYTASGTFLVPGHAAAGTVEELATGTKAVTHVADLGPADAPVAAWQLSPTVLLTVDHAGVTWWDPTRLYVPPFPVTLSIADPTPFIGTYQRVVLDLGTTGYSMDDLDLTISGGSAAGSFSYSRDDLSAPDEAMLLVGYAPGKRTIDVIHRPSATRVGTLDIRTVDTWTDTVESPPHWLSGPVGDFHTGYTWGGGSTTPQNVDVFPQSGSRGIAILMVDVSDARYPTGAGLDTIRTSWRDSAVGATGSARVFYEEVSHGTFTLGLQGTSLPLVSINDTWANQFTTMPSPWPSNSFAPTNSTAFAQACISNAAGQVDASNHPIIDFSQVRSVILVVRSAGTASTDNYFWPQAWGGNFTIPGGTQNLNILGMPDDWEPTRDTRTRTETMCHEMGHNLGYPDLYTNVSSWNYSADIQARDVTNLDLMSREAQLPDMSIAQRMETGWVRPTWVQTFDFSRSTIPLSQTVTLHAVEDGAPPAGELTGIEIRIADGWNYYFEYRRTEPGQVGDQELGSDASTGNGAVVGTDVISQSFAFPINRPQVIRLRPDAEGENSFFVAGQDYKEKDTSSMAVADFRMSVLSASGNDAQVKIEYGTNGRPDLYIRPWPGGDNWQSPDIEIRNARSIADPGQWFNTPWEGHVNTVVAKYHNRGPVTCQNVQVEFFVKDYTVSNAPEASLGTDTHDVPPESSTPTVEFSTQWLPGNQGHRCIIARTPLYVDTSVNPNVVELSDSNNSAQSNYTHYISASSSPGRRVRSAVALYNPWPGRALMYVVPQLSGAFSQYYRVYLGQQAVTLDPGETRYVEVMVESMFGDPRMSGVWREQAEKIFRVPTNVSLAGYGVPPEAPLHPQLLGGAQMTVSSAWGTKFDGPVVQDGSARGAVVSTSTGKGVTGHVLVTFHGPRETFANTVTVPLGANGTFALETRPYMDKFRSKEISLHYPGVPGFAPCDPDKDRYPL